MVCSRAALRSSSSASRRELDLIDESMTGDDIKRGVPVASAPVVPETSRHVTGLGSASKLRASVLEKGASEWMQLELLPTFDENTDPNRGATDVHRTPAKQLHSQFSVEDGSYGEGRQDLPSPRRRVLRRPLRRRSGRAPREAARCLRSRRSSRWPIRSLPASRSPTRRDLTPTAGFVRPEPPTPHWHSSRAWSGSAPGPRRRGSCAR